MGFIRCAKGMHTHGHLMPLSLCVWSHASHSSHLIVSTLFCLTRQREAEGCHVRWAVHAP